MSNLSYFHFSVDALFESSSASGGSTLLVPVTFEGDAAAPDRISGALVLNLSVFALEMEIISVGGDIYTTNPATGVWELAPLGSVAVPNPALLTSGGAPPLVDATVVGEETIDGVRAIRLRGAARLDSLEGLEGEFETADVWIGADDGLVYRISSEGVVSLESLGLPLPNIGLSGDATLSLDMRFSRFDQPVIIEPPNVPAP